MKLIKQKCWVEVDGNDKDGVPAKFLILSRPPMRLKQEDKYILSESELKELLSEAIDKTYEQIKQSLNL